nr:Lrp/AsnC family transcriptional regulator [Roseovarius sp. EL26]
MDGVDKKISRLIQSDGRISSAQIAEAVGVSVSTANERLRRLVAQGIVKEWRGVLDPDKVGAALCVFVFVDVSYEGEAEACAALIQFPEVLELHHISGPHSYLMKVRVQNTTALQQFMQTCVKPLKAVLKTETILSLEAQKETTAVKISPQSDER